MTKAELIKALEIYDDDTPVYVVAYAGDPAVDTDALFPMEILHEAGGPKNAAGLWLTPEYANVVDQHQWLANKNK